MVIIEKIIMLVISVTLINTFCMHFFALNITFNTSSLSVKHILNKRMKKMIECSCHSVFENTVSIIYTLNHKLC